MLNREEHDATVGAGYNSAIIMEEKYYPEYQAKTAPNMEAAYYHCKK
ncbi:hypothetical protein [Xenorhabdus sp. PB62.4]|nr:hypothetical protein [Xenorhabdus sp. PB62.4]MBC8952904.1 hypothetical protein [Xenorhabdus sp. PB62.4]